MVAQTEAREVHYNKPQLRSMAVMAQHEVAIWGRGTGKSDGLIAPRVSHCAFAMPRSMGALIGRSYSQILTRTLPAMVRGLERRGYKLNRDFTVRERGPRSWELPLFTPMDWHNFVHIRCGSALALVSQQNPGSANGPSFDYAAGDEAKFLKKEQYEEELLPAMRGNRDRFGHLSCHQSTLLATDMPTTPSSRWLLEKENEMDVECIDVILATQFEISKLTQAIASGALSTASARVYQSRINSLERDLNLLRKGTLYFSMASAMDNIDVLGVEYIARQRRLLPDYLFRTSIMNMRPDRVEGGFYPWLDDEQHTYIAPPSAFVSAAGNELFTKDDIEDCRKDGDLVSGVRLMVGPDFGSSFNCMVVGQLFHEQFSILNQVFVKHPLKIRDLARRFHNYYLYHSPHAVRINYDHTMIGEDAVRSYGFILELQRELEALGWEVELYGIGAAPGHHEKYVFWGRIAVHADEALPVVKWNAVNCEPTLLAMRLAQAKQLRNKFEKDKSAERDPNADQAETTHLTDACDLLVIGCMLSLGVTSTRDVGLIL